MARLTRVSDTTMLYANNIYALRQLEPVRDGQIATLLQYREGTGLGGGLFRGVLGDGGLQANTGTIIRTDAGNTWVRLNADVTNPLMFGAYCDGKNSDHQAILDAIRFSRYSCDGLGLEYYINDTIYMNTIEKAREFKNARIFAMASLPDGRPMMRMCNAQHVSDLYMNGSLQNKITIGILWEGGRTTDVGGSIRNSEFVNIGAQAIYVGCDYTNKKFPRYGFISNIRIDSCGHRGTGNGRVSLGSDGLIDFHIDNVTATKCNWGIYIRNDLFAAGNERKSGNKLTNITLIGSGRKHATFTDAQGISCGYQYGLMIDSVKVSDFADNAIDMQFCDKSQVSNWMARSCKDGIFMGDRGCHGHVVTNGIAQDCDRAVRLITDGGDDFVVAGQRPQLISTQISNVHAYNPIYEGFLIRNTGKSKGSNMRDVKLIGCTVDASGSWSLASQRTGFNIVGGEQVLIEGCYVYNVAVQGVWVEDSDFVTISNCNFQNISRRGGQDYAVHFKNSPRSFLNNNRFYGVYGVCAFDVGSPSGRAVGNRWRTATRFIEVNSSIGNIVQDDNIAY